MSNINKILLLILLPVLLLAQDISKINGTATSSISNISGIAKASISKINGMTLNAGGGVSLIVEADFEEGNITDFTSNGVETGNTIAASTVQKHGGTYSALFTEGGTNNRCFGDISLSNLSEVYIRAYVWISSTFSSSGTYKQVPLVTLKNTNTAVARLGLYTDDSPVFYRWSWSGSELTADDNPSILADQWVRVEIHYVKGTGAGDGSVECKLNGTTVFTEAGLNLTNTVNALEIGTPENVSVIGIGIYYVDDIAVSADDWIGE